MELPGHVDDQRNSRRLRLPDGGPRRRLLPLPRPVLLCSERPSALLEDAGAVADRRHLRADDTGQLALTSAHEQDVLCTCCG